MSVTELERATAISETEEQWNSRFEKNLYQSLGLTSNQLDATDTSFDEQVTRLFSPENFLEIDDYTSRHYFANTVVKNWPALSETHVNQDHLNHPEESYKSFLLRVTPIVENAYSEIEIEDPGRIAYSLIQGLIQTEISLRNDYNERFKSDIPSLPIGKRNRMLFYLSDALISSECE